MTIEELLKKINDKKERVSEMNDKINAVQSEIAALDNQKQASVQNGYSDQAIKFMKKRRDKEDELQVLKQVVDNIIATPAVSENDILQAWNVISGELLSEYEEKILPELKESYSRYCQAIESVVSLRQKAQTPAAQLETAAKTQGFNMALENPFKTAEPYKYAVNKSTVAKLNCLYNTILNTPISKPVSYDLIK